MIRIGSRGSKLAMAQTSWVKEQLLALQPSADVEIRVIRTSADLDTTTSLRAAGSTGVFVRELEEALLAGEIDLAVHSMKDLPTRLPDGLSIAAVPVREDVRDAVAAGMPLSGFCDLPAGAAVGTGSLRRAAQLLAQRPDLRIKDIRGNVDTRLAKLDRGDYDAVILACAGLNRLGLAGRIRCAIDAGVMLPAPGQGALALETRGDDLALRERLAPLHDVPTAIAVSAEREFLRAMGGGCNTPIGVLASWTGDSLRLDAVASLPDGSNLVRDRTECPPDRAADAASDLAQSILRKAGSSLLAYLR